MPVAPKPTALRLIDGDRADRINENEPIPRPSPPEPPPGMDAEAREVWDYTVAELDAMGIAVAADRDPLACYCEAVVNHRKATAWLRKSDVLLIGKEGRPVKNPATVVQNHSAAIIRALAQEFGLTPSARTRIEVERGVVDDDNPFAGTG